MHLQRRSTSATSEARTNVLFSHRGEDSSDVRGEIPILQMATIAVSGFDSNASVAGRSDFREGADRLSELQVGILVSRIDGFPQASKLDRHL